MLASKVFNLRHCNSVLNAIAGDEPFFDNQYFTLGLPQLDPPIIRGSFLLVLSSQFIDKNINAIKWWSPTDLGGLRDGFLETHCDEDIKDCQLSRESLMSFLDVLGDLPSKELWQWLRHRTNPSAEEAALSFLPKSVAEIVRNSTNPHRLLCEFVIHGHVPIDPKQVLGLFCPTSYVEHPAVSRIYNAIGDRLYSYDAKYGIEEAERFFDIFNWSV